MRKETCVKGYVYTTEKVVLLRLDYKLSRCLEADTKPRNIVSNRFAYETMVFNV